MKLTSPAFVPNASIPKIYTPAGKNSNPPLSIDEVPDGTKSLALIMHDPDASAGDWVHWTLWNIDPHTTNIAENFLPPEASQGLTNFNTIGYHGPCPPKGIHRYVFDLYALHTQLALNAGANRTQLMSAIDGHVLATAQLVGVFGS